eukprot:COSAG01_NODE_9826_length_2330_cov_13.072613_1_plen_271_part_00
MVHGRVHRAQRDAMRAWGALLSRSGAGGSSSVRMTPPSPQAAGAIGTPMRLTSSSYVLEAPAPVPSLSVEERRLSVELAAASVSADAAEAALMEQARKEEQQETVAVLVAEGAQRAAAAAVQQRRHEQAIARLERRHEESAAMMAAAMAATREAAERQGAEHAEALVRALAEGEARGAEAERRRGDGRMERAAAAAREDALELLAVVRGGGGAPPAEGWLLCCASRPQLLRLVCARCGVLCVRVCAGACARGGAVHHLPGSPPSLYATLA